MSVSSAKPLGKAAFCTSLLVPPDVPAARVSRGRERNPPPALPRPLGSLLCPREAGGRRDVSEPRSPGSRLGAMEHTHEDARCGPARPPPGKDCASAASEDFNETLAVKIHALLTFSEVLCREERKLRRR